MISPRMCARVGCGDTNTKPVKIAGLGGKAYVLNLCAKHREDLDICKPPNIPITEPHAILCKHGEVVADVYRCFGISLMKYVTIGDKPYDALTWRQFYRRNRRLKVKGEWFFDDWLVQRLKVAIHLFGHYYMDVTVLMPRKPMPLLVQIPVVFADEWEVPWCMMIAPIIPNPELYMHAHV